jgi:hypothetical protein
VKATADEEATVRRAVEDAVVKAAADGDSPAPSQAPSVAETKRTAAPPRLPNVPTGVFGNLGLSSLSLFFSRGFTP